MSGREIAVAAPGGSFAAYLAGNAAGQARPGIVILTPIFGVEPAMRGFAERYAERGFITLVPNLFWRSQPDGVVERTPGTRPAALARAAAIDVEVCAGDVGAAIQALRALRECNGAVAALGFCFGGRYAWLAAARGVADAAAAYHGTQIGQSLARERPPAVPISLHFGGADVLTPPDEIAAISAALRDNREADVCVYPSADHNFVIPDNPNYQAPAARLAEARVLALFDRLKDRAR